MARFYTINEQNVAKGSPQRAGPEAPSHFSNPDAKITRAFDTPFFVVESSLTNQVIDLGKTRLITWSKVSIRDQLTNANTTQAQYDSKIALLGVTAANDPGLKLQCLRKTCQGNVSDVNCSIDCCVHIRDHNFKRNEKKLEIRTSDPTNPALGDENFVNPGQTIKRGTIIGEYIGQLHPRGLPNSSYNFGLNSTVPGVTPNYPKLCIDSLKVGNWTRSMNHRCKPNVGTQHSTIGKTRIITFVTFKDLNADDQLYINYGKAYFESGSVQCLCDTFGGEPHDAYDDDDVLTDFEETEEDNSMDFDGGPVSPLIMRDRSRHGLQ
ncbi:hypothetical protein QBC38DRAFT_501296 [Podospora fimiseda]|uniref:SET domain-containing protein n=1 Tax=Podospora fimiseda TaxID=252190 RepID=A0AAN7BLB9_9PEZI|nr:hypothetical protein QBC38DRAFT_501296 [Podospora fimiseda]